MTKIANYHKNGKILKVIINGKEENLHSEITILTLLQQRNIRKEVVEVELNGNIVKKENYDKITLKDKDVLEFIFYMGGGKEIDSEGPTSQLDLRGVCCPINFVKTKLKLEEMKTGEILEVILDDGEPIRNVPRSVKDEGHQIINVEKFGDVFRLLIKKVDSGG